MSDLLLCYCPQCRRPLHCPTAYRGRDVTCKACHMDFPAVGETVPLIVRKPLFNPGDAGALIGALIAGAIFLFIVSAIFGFNPWS